MIKFAIGLALMWIITMLTGGKFKAEGIGGCLIAGFICYGLGSIVMLLLQRSCN